MSEPGFDAGPILARILGRWRRYLLIGLLSAGAMYGLTFLMPPTYRSRAALLPPEETDQLGANLMAFRFMTRMPGLGGTTEYHTTGDVYRAILMSRTVLQSIVDQFDLRSVYRMKSNEKTLKNLRSNTKITLGADGLLAIEVEDRSRERAAAMANALIEELDRYNVERRNTQAKRTRMFLERRVGETDSLSKQAEAALRKYQEVHHVVAPVEMESAVVQPLAELMARKVALEVQLSVLRSYLREDNERVLQVRTELEQLNKRIGEAPRLENELSRLIRDVKLYQQTYILLTGQLEEARLRETMDTPTVTVLDYAVPVERRASPRRSLWALAALGLSVIACIAWDERRTTTTHRPLSVA